MPRYPAARFEVLANVSAALISMASSASPSANSRWQREYRLPQRDCTENRSERREANKKSRRKPAAFVFQRTRRGLFGRLLPRRVERAGIVDFGDLVVGEAEHLAQDFVGVLAEQRGTRHIAR
jgi:hypothetical protein